eukprot:g13996.t1
MAVDFAAYSYSEWDFYVGEPAVSDAAKIATHLVALDLVPHGPLRDAIMPAGGDLKSLAEDGPIEALDAAPSAAAASKGGKRPRRYALDDTADEGGWLEGSGSDGGGSDVEVAGSGKGDPDISHITRAQFEAYAAMLASKKQAGASGDGNMKGEFPKPPKQKMTAAQAREQKRREKFLSQQARVEQEGALVRARQAQEAAGRARSLQQGGRGAGANAAALQAAKDLASQRSAATGTGGGMGVAPQQAPFGTVGAQQQHQQQPYAGQLHLTPEVTSSVMQLLNQFGILQHNGGVALPAVQHSGFAFQPQQQFGTAGPAGGANGVQHNLNHHHHHAVGAAVGGHAGGGVGYAGHVQHQHQHAAAVGVGPAAAGAGQGVQQAVHPGGPAAGGVGYAGHVQHQHEHAAAVGVGHAAAAAGAGPPLQQHAMHPGGAAAPAAGNGGFVGQPAVAPPLAGAGPGGQAPIAPVVAVDEDRPLSELRLRLSEYRLAGKRQTVGHLRRLMAAVNKMRNTRTGTRLNVTECYASLGAGIASGTVSRWERELQFITQSDESSLAEARKSLPSDLQP